jgi:hypothetical protein
MPSRKTVSVDILREILGDGQTDELLEKLNSPKPTVSVDVRSLTLARTLYSHPLTDSKNWADTLPVVRRYFLDQGRSRRAFLAWLDGIPTGQVKGAGAESPAKRSRQESMRVPK